MPLSGTIMGLVDLVETNALDLVQPSGHLLKKGKIVYTDGTGLNKIQQLFSDQRLLADGANENLDLAAVLVDMYGNSLTFANIKGVLIASAAANTTNLTLTEPAANGLINMFVAASDGIIIQPGGVFLHATPSIAGLPVTAGTGDLLNIANAAGAAATYDVAIWGE